MVIAVSYHDTVTKLQAPAGDPPGPFDRLEWFDLLAQDEARPVFACASDANDSVCLPLRETPRGLESLTYWYSFTWRALGKNRVLLTALVRDLRRATHRLTLSPLPEEDGSTSLLEGVLKDAGWVVLREQCDENHVLPVAGRSFAQYWQARPGAMRTTLKRKGKKVTVEFFVHFDDGAWDAYRAVYTDSWKPDEERAGLLEAFARAEGAAGRIRMAIARADGVPVAAQFWTVERGTAYIHKLAHVEAAKALSAGTTLSAALFERLIDIDGVEMVDFGTGSDAYKRDWMEVVRPRYRLDCFNLRQPRAWLPLAKALARRLARTMQHK